MPTAFPTSTQASTYTSRGCSLKTQHKFPSYKQTKYTLHQTWGVQVQTPKFLQLAPPFPFRLQHTQINLWSQGLPGAMHKPQGQKWSLDPKKNRHRFLDHVIFPPFIAHSFCEGWAILIHHLNIRIVHSQSPKEGSIFICQVYLVPLPKEANLDHTIENILEILEL